MWKWGAEQICTYDFGGYMKAYSCVLRGGRGKKVVLKMRTYDVLYSIVRVNK